MDLPPLEPAMPLAPPRGLAAWQAAWQGLPENPIAHYLHKAEQRRRQRSRRRSVASYILLTVIFGGFWLLVIFGEMIFGGGWIDLDWRFTTIAVLGFISVFFCLWLGVGIYNAVRDALLVLAPPTKLTSSLALDDTLAASSLGDEDIVLGVLRILLPSLWWRGLAGSVLFWLWMLVAMTSGLEQWKTEAEQLLVLMPLAIFLMLLSSALGAVSLLLFYLAISQSRSVIALSAGAILVTLGQLVWIAVGPTLAFVDVYAVDEFRGVEQSSALGLWIAGQALCLFLIALAALRGRYSKIMRSASTIVGPWLLPLLVVMALVIWQVVVQFNGFDDSGKELSVLLLSFMNAWGNVMPFNSSAMHGPLLTGILESRPELYWQLVRIPVAYMLQFGLIAALAWAARDSVRRRRTEGMESRG